MVSIIHDIEGILEMKFENLYPKVESESGESIEYRELEN